MRTFWASLLIALTVCASAPSNAQTDTFIEVKLERQKDGKAVYQRAILTTPSGRRPETVVLFFRGGHGVAMLERADDRRRSYPLFLGPNLGMFLDAGIALAIVDCPTDEWGKVEGNRAYSCLDTYRSTEQHANDVRAIMDRLKTSHGAKKFFVFGHSKGSLSSRWLAVNLGNEIAGSIHSASMSQPDPWGNGQTIYNLPYDKITAPAIWLHHERDACPTTSYFDAKQKAGDERLITVRGGTPTGEICANHHHGYDGRGAEATRAVVNWVYSGKREPFAGNP